MARLRSREVVSSPIDSKDTKMKESGVSEPSTPANSVNLVNQASPNGTPSMNTVGGSVDPKESGSVVVSRPVRRRSLRLAEKSGSVVTEEEKNVENKEVINENGNHMDSEMEEDLGNLKIESVNEVKMEVMVSEQADVEIKTESIDDGEMNVRVSEQADVKMKTEFITAPSSYKLENVWDAIEEAKTGAMEAEMKAVMVSSSVKSEKAVESDRKGKGKRSLGPEITEVKCASLMPKRVCKIGDEGESADSMENVKLSREEKGKGTMDETTSSKMKVEKDLPTPGVMTRGRLSREDKGKDKVTDDSSETNISNTINFETLLDSTMEQIPEVIVNPIPERRDPRERFRNFARRNASRFAHFASQEDDIQANNVPNVVQTPSIEEDWPGPFSTAMKIIKDRETNLKSKTSQPNAFFGKREDSQIKWVPKKDQVNQQKKSVPLLQELCWPVLVKNSEAITSLDCIPDVLKHKLSQLLCDTRKMDSHFLKLLVSGSPTEIRVYECSWLSEEMITKIFQGCDTKNLTVLQLDLCGRCLPDYILPDTFAPAPNSLPLLTTISLKGAYRLSDNGIKTLVSSAPALRSVNLTQCSLLTSEGVSVLADSLGPTLRELYLDECQGINPMLILPSLLKLQNVEVLSLSGNETVSDQFIKKFVTACGHNLKELILGHCVALTDASVKIIAEKCPGLSAIDLSNVLKLTDASVGYLANGCSAIQKLILGRNKFSDEAIAAYLETCGESLDELSLNYISQVSNNTALSLAKCGKNLTSLDLSWCRKLSNEALGLIVDSCLSLKLLKLFGCTQITDVFVKGHSNPQVKIVGLRMTPVLQHLKEPDFMRGPLRYSSAY